jgi:hypothetical protein
MRLKLVHRVHWAKAGQDNSQKAVGIVVDHINGETVPITISMTLLRNSGWQDRVQVRMGQDMAEVVEVDRDLAEVEGARRKITDPGSEGASRVSTVMRAGKGDSTRNAEQDQLGREGLTELATLAGDRSGSPGRRREDDRRRDDRRDDRRRDDRDRERRRDDSGRERESDRDRERDRDRDRDRRR